MRKLRILSLWVILLLAACEGEPLTMEEAALKQEREMTCTHMKNEIIRCESEEAICYVITGYRRGGISCKFKDK